MSQALWLRRSTRGTLLPTCVSHQWQDFGAPVWVMPSPFDPNGHWNQGWKLLVILCENCGQTPLETLA